MKELKERLLRVKKVKFMRNIIIGVISLIVVALIINIAPGYKRDKYKDVINLILNEENKTEQLKHEIYINEKGTIYISEEDIKNLFDETIFYDQEHNQIITTTDTKVVNIAIDEKEMIINGATQPMIDAVVRINNDIYLPITDMNMVYNIDIKYVESTNRVIIDNLDKGIIKATITEETDIRFKPRGLSKSIGTLKKGQSVYCFYTTSKGWRQIRTEEGKIRIYKS